MAYVSGPDGTPEAPPEQVPGRRRAETPRPSRSETPPPETQAYSRPAARPASRPPSSSYPMIPASGRPAARPAGARRADVPRPDPLTDPLTVARRAQPTPSVATPPPTLPQASTTTAARPAGRRIAPPEDRQPDIPPADPLTETGSHARIVEPIADPPAPAPVPAPVVPTGKAGPVRIDARTLLRRRLQPKPKAAPKGKAAPQVKAAPKPPPAVKVEPAPVARVETPPPPPPAPPAPPAPKVEKPVVKPVEKPAVVLPHVEKPTVEKPKVDRAAARRAAEATRAATAAPAAKKAVRDAAAASTSTTVTRTAAERRAQLVERVAATRTTSLTENESWLAVLLVGALAVAVARLAPDLPELIRNVGGVLVTSALAWGLAVRTGGRPVWATALAAALGLGAIITQWPSLMAGASVGTAVLAATLAVMVTTPAATFGIAIKEVLIASAVAWVGALGVLGYGDHSNLDVARFGYVVFALSLVGAFGLVYRLGAGLHGLGRRGYAVAGGATLILFVGMAYSEAISQYGSRDVLDVLDDVRGWMRGTFGAVPHPIMALLGYPALVWGVFMRARRRQGWWVCAFGVAATASSASRLIAEDLGVASVVLGEVYSLVIGLALGYLVIRGEQSFTGSHGRRARRSEEAEAHRPEPLRTRALH